jgi:hypothetical protein
MDSVTYPQNRNPASGLNSAHLSDRDLCSARRCRAVVIGGLLTLLSLDFLADTNRGLYWRILIATISTTNPVNADRSSSVRS